MEQIKQSFTLIVKLKNHNVSFTHFMVSYCYLLVSFSIFQKWCILLFHNFFGPRLRASMCSGPHSLNRLNPRFLRHWTHVLYRSIFPKILWVVVRVGPSHNWKQEVIIRPEIKIWEESKVAVNWPCIAMHGIDMLYAFHRYRSFLLEVESQIWFSLGVFQIFGVWW